MLISRTSQYAIQSMIYIATQPLGTLILSRDVAEKLQVPAAYLAKIMQTLCKGGLVSSLRGRHGGFCLREDQGEINLMRILLITEGPEFTKNCLLGLKVCSDETACPMHVKFKPIKQEIIELLTRKTLTILSEAVLVDKYRISDLPYILLPEKGEKVKERRKTRKRPAT
ncbi:HTH-type transcriptional regulator IscR [mine drainage metagenome]|uniref:HTH-type transcriptional regulator IscR n=1 Tax=mine drainage metagenome TaxID=410659 RepID=A0A1J5Q1I9_9ZZZZ